MNVSVSPSASNTDQVFLTPSLLVVLCPYCKRCYWNDMDNQHAQDLIDMDYYFGNQWYNLMYRSNRLDLVKKK